MPSATPLPHTLGAVIARCQALMGDAKGFIISRPYAVPFINQAYEDIASQIKNASGKNLEAVLEILAVPAGISDLSTYQDDDKPFAGLFDPLRMWVKTAGQLPQYYTEANGPRDTLPHVNPPGITPGTYAVQVTWAWIGNKLSVTPVAGSVDIQLYGRFNVPPLAKDEDKLILYPGMTAMLAYSACSLMGVERTNPAILQGYIERATAMIDNAVADIIRQSQGNPRRLAKMGGQGGSAWGWGSGV